MSLLHSTVRPSNQEVDKIHLNTFFPAISSLLPTQMYAAQSVYIHSVGCQALSFQFSWAN